MCLCPWVCAFKGITLKQHFSNFNVHKTLGDFVKMLILI